MARVLRAPGRPWLPPRAPVRVVASHTAALGGGLVLAGLVGRGGDASGTIVVAGASLVLVAGAVLLRRPSRSQRDASAPTSPSVASSDAVLTVDLDGTVRSLNPAAEELFGHASDEVAGQDVSLLMIPAVSSEELALVGSPAGRAPIRQLPALGRALLGLRRDGRTFALDLTVVDVELNDRTVTTLVARDVSRRRGASVGPPSQGTHDVLTGLPNGVLFLDRLEEALLRAVDGHTSVAVLCCDLDRFKVVNDGLGHEAGDALLVAVGERFTAAVPGATVARLAGDEFAVLVESTGDGDRAGAAADALAASLATPITVAGQEVVISTSIGIARGPDGDQSAEALLRDADVALHRAKGSGASRRETFDPGVRRAAFSRLGTEAALRRAVREDRLVVRYQPEIDLRGGTLSGVEALVRWERGDGELVLPSAFLPLAEETGLVVAIGEAVLRQACEQAARWHEQLDGKAPTVWVNVSARQLADSRLVTKLAAACDQFLPRPGALGIEITETDLVPDDEDVQRAMFELTELGVGIAIDDFGTGYASLAYLWRFPADVVKIDRAFVRRLGEERDGTVIIASVIQLARSLGKRTVAEGIETATQLSRLRRLGCDAGQGFLLAAPVGSEEIEALVVAPPGSTLPP